MPRATVAVHLPLALLILAAPACSSSDGGGGDDDDQPTPCDDCADDLFVDLPDEGSVTVTLHPGATVQAGDPTRVSFGIPLPPGTVADVANLRVTQGGVELAAAITELVRWRPLGGSGEESVRAALIVVDVSFAAIEPLELAVHWGQARSSELADPGAVRATWVAMADDDPSGYDRAIEEPAVFAALPAEWLGQSLLRTRVASPADVPDLAWFTDVSPEFGRTIVNDVPPEVTATLDIAGDPEPWLFDRTSTLFGLYVQTGDVVWLRHAHRSAQFYRQHLVADGSFDLKDGRDLKYSYGRALLLDYIFTGDPDVIEPMAAIAAFGEDWDEVYDLDDNFFTERHQAYALLAALSAWELTGEARHGDRARAIVEASIASAAAPPGGWAPHGCILHTEVSHEGDGGDAPICSPWMSALLADGLWLYYVQSRDVRVLELLASLGDFVTDHALYTGAEDLDRIVPWYLASSEAQLSEGGPWNDIEHNCDVGGMVARAAWARAELGFDPATLVATRDTLLEGCEFILDYWHRPSGPSSGQAEWRLSPSRKFNWWFGTTSDLPWLVAAVR